jgi:hypothetical protein
MYLFPCFNRAMPRVRPVGPAPIHTHIHTHTHTHILHIHILTSFPALGVRCRGWGRWVPRRLSSNPLLLWCGPWLDGYVLLWVVCVCVCVWVFQCLCALVSFSVFLCFCVSVFLCLGLSDCVYQLCFCQLCCSVAVLLSSSVAQQPHYLNFILL